MNRKKKFPQLANKIEIPISPSLSFQLPSFSPPPPPSRPSSGDDDRGGHVFNSSSAKWRGPLGTVRSAATVVLWSQLAVPVHWR